MLGQDSLANGRGRDLIKSPTKQNTSKHFKMSNGSDKKKDFVVNSYFYCFIASDRFACNLAMRIKFNTRKAVSIMR